MNQVYIHTTGATLAFVNQIIRGTTPTGMTIRNRLRKCNQEDLGKSFAGERADAETLNTPAKSRATILRNSPRVTCSLSDLTLTTRSSAQVSFPPIISSAFTCGDPTLKFTSCLKHV